MFSLLSTHYVLNYKAIAEVIAKSDLLVITADQTAAVADLIVNNSYKLKCSLPIV